jgi:hypothetical protein
MEMATSVVIYLLLLALVSVILKQVLKRWLDEEYE